MRGYQDLNTEAFLNMGWVRDDNTSQNQVSGKKGYVF